MAVFHNQVKLTAFDFPEFQLTVNLDAGTVTDNIGLAVSQLTSADNSVKLADDGEAIIGVLYTVEDRVNENQLIGTVKFKFAEKLKIQTGQTVVVGNRICGAGNGEVRALDPLNADDAKLIPYAPRVWAVASGYASATLF